MMSLMQSEYLKTKRSFARKTVFLLPAFAVFLAVALMGGRFVQTGALNWWYTMLLPAMLPLICAALIQKDRKMGYFNTAILPISQRKTMLGKLAVGWMLLFAANLVVFLLTSLAGYFFGSQYPMLSGLMAALVLTLTYAWQIPACLLLAAKTGPVACFFISLPASVVFSWQPFAGGRLWMIPFAIPARLMAPVIGVNPNGVPLEAVSPLWNPAVILPGILIALALAALVTFLACRWNQKRGE